MIHERVQPEGWARPRGYSNGVLAEGRVLALGGQIGWNAQQEFETDTFLGQFDQTLANVRAILDAAGAGPEHLIQMTIYVTDLDAYRASLSDLGPIWKRHLGRNYPAMALVGVVGLVEPQALLEIESLAVLPQEATS